jgi:hypothetical protein
MSKRLFAALLLLLAATTAGAAGEFYCCPDPASGRRVCGDTLPEQCRGRAYRVLDSGGNIIKEVGPPLSPEQKVELATENRRKKQLEEAARELRRRDQALLDTYSTPQDIDLAQSKAEADVNLAMQDTQARIDAAHNKRKKFEAEAEFYQKKSMPSDLEKELRALAHEIKVQQELLDVKKHDLDAIKGKYDADRKRYFELTGRALPKTAPASPR